MTDIQSELHRSLRFLAAATLALFMALLIVGALLTTYGFRQQNKIEQVTLATTELAASTHGALCTFVDDLKQRASDSQKFLDTHPGGIAGITAEAIQQGIDNQMRTIDALASLNCR